MSVDPGSIQAELRGLLIAKLNEKTVDLPLPRFDGRLWSTYRAVHWEDQKRIAKRNARLKEAAAEVSSAADTLIEACVTTFAVLPDDTRHDLQLRLGRPLAQYLGLDVEGVTDRQALHLMFTDMQIIGHAAEFGRWVAGEASVTAEDEAAADFPEAAPSS